MSDEKKYLTWCPVGLGGDWMMGGTDDEAKIPSVVASMAEEFSVDASEILVTVQYTPKQGEKP